MKIEMLANNILKLSVSYSMGSRLMGLLIFIFTGFLVIHMIGSYQIHCNHILPNDARECVLNYSFFGMVPEKTELHTLKAAWVNAQKSTGNTYSIYLETENSSINMTSGSSVGYAKKQQIADAINQFIAHGDKNEINLGNPESWWVTLLILVFPSIGLVMMFFTSKVEVVFDKSRGILSHSKKSIFNTKVEQFDLSNVDKIILESSGSHSSTSYRLVIMMNDGSAVRVTSYLLSSGYNSNKRAADKINTFLGSDTQL